MSVATERWTPSYAEVAMLIRWLDLTGAIYTLEEAATVAEKPWRYREQFLAMRELQDRLAEEDAA